MNLSVAGVHPEAIFAIRPGDQVLLESLHAGLRLYINQRVVGLLTNVQLHWEIRGIANRLHVEGECVAGDARRSFRLILI